MAKRTVAVEFGPRIHFNWGYHDGAGDVRNGRVRLGIPTGELFALPAANRAYCSGYHAGVNDARDGGYAQDSTAAWEASMK